MNRERAQVIVRGYREGDEKAAAELLNQYVAGFLGAASVTPELWREHHEVGWRPPTLSRCPDCFRIAERDGVAAGYAVVGLPEGGGSQFAVVQELCVAEGEEGEEVAGALLADAEQIARSRGATAVLLQLGHEDGFIRRLTQARDYDWLGPESGVFMAAVSDLAGLLGEMQAELSARLGASRFSRWQGVVEIRSGAQSARLQLAEGRVRVVEPGGEPSFSAEVSAEVLPLLLFGRVSVRQAFLQDEMAIAGDDRTLGLELLDTLFPRLPMYLPVSQSW